MKIGLALGGGGARGLAHIGVLRTLEENNISLYQISGTSIGAIIGGLYAKYKSVDKVESFIYNLVESTVFKNLNLDAFDPETEVSGYWKEIVNSAQRNLSFLRMWRYSSVINDSVVNGIFKKYPDDPVESLPIKFAAIATDLISGRETVIVEGSLKKAVIASSSIPGIFPPVERFNARLVDGGISDLVPVYVARGQGSEYVIAVDVTKSLDNIEPLTNGLSIIDRSQTILAFQLARERLAGADMVIRPSSRRFSWASVKHMPEIIESGKTAAEAALPKLLEMLKR
ncbi:MAG: patatin [Chlorobi bacterium]|nr:patatin [Chlorobiota bacterium]